MWHSTVLFLALFIRSFTDGAARPPRLVTAPVAAKTNNSTDLDTNVTILHNINGHHKAYFVNMSSVRDVFTVQRPITLEKVSSQSRQDKCHFAVNGGPFQSNGDSVGGVVVDGQVVSPDFQDFNVGFGRIYTNQWILGGITNSSEVTSLQVEHYMTGFDWLVYEGKVVVKSERRHLRKHHRAPRTAIGVDKYGHLLLLVVDGCEACFRHQGLTVEELASLFQAHGVHHAINLDGGGSTTLVQDSQVLNVPTCRDVPWKCERPVSTIVCLQRKDVNNKESESLDNEEEEAQ